MTITELWAHPPRQRADRVDLTALPDGKDLLHLFHGFAADVAAESLLKEANESVALVTSLEPKGRVVTLAVEVGRYGEKGTITDVDTMTPHTEFTARDAVTVVTHAVLTLPPGSSSALVFLERSANQNGVVRIIELFAAEFRRSYNLILESTSVVESEAWLRQASLVRVSAHRRARATDSADSTADRIQPVGYGELAHTLVPARGERSLPRYIYDRLTTGDLGPSELLGFDETEDADEVEVTLEHNRQRKTFVLGHEKRPSISYLLSDHNQPVWSADTIRSHVLANYADDLYSRIGVEWTPELGVGTWTDDEVRARLVVRGGEQD